MTTTTDKGKRLSTMKSDAELIALCDYASETSGLNVSDRYVRNQEFSRVFNPIVVRALIERARAAEARAIAAEEALKLAEAKADMLADSNYLAGVQAGFNAAQDPNPNKALAAIQNAYQGHIRDYRALSTEAQS